MSEKRPYAAWLLIGLSVLALGLTSPAVTFLRTFFSSPADWGRLYFCSAMLLPALFALIAADRTRAYLTRSSGNPRSATFVAGFALYVLSVIVWVVAAAPLALGWLIIFAFAGKSPG